MGNLGRRAPAAVLIAMLGGCGSCDEEPAVPEPVLPRATAWIPQADPVVVGTPARFTVTLDWDGVDPRGWELYTSYDLPGQTLRPPSEAVEWDGTSSVTVTLPSDEHGVAVASGFLYVCKPGFVLLEGDCAYGALEPGRARIAGGDTAYLFTPAPEPVRLVTGERRPFHVTPIAYRPVSQRLGDNDVTYGSDPVTYTSFEPSVVTVDADGVLTAVAPGTAVISASAGAVARNFQVEVVDGELGPPSAGVHPMTSGLWPWSEPGSSAIRQSPTMIGIGPDGDLAVVGRILEAPDDTGEVHIASHAPVYLIRWTGSGFGYELLNAWHEEAEEAYLGVGVDGHLVAGWRSDFGAGVVALDRTADAVVGGWRRRMLSVAPVVGAPPPIDPVWEPGRNRPCIGGCMFRIATLPDDDGAWVASMFAYRLPELGYDRQDFGFASQCAAWIRIARIGATRFEEVDVERTDIVNGLQPGDCEGIVDPARTLSLGPPAPGTALPQVSVLRVVDGVADPDLVWSYSPFSDVPAELLGAGATGKTVAFPLDGVGHFVATGHALVGAQRNGYGGGTNDVVLAPLYPDATFEASIAEPGLVTSDAAHAYVVTTYTPQAPGEPYDASLHVVPLPRPVRHDDPEALGRRLGTDPIPELGADLVVLGDGRRVWFPAASRRLISGGPDQPLVLHDVEPLTFASSYRLWVDGSTIYLAHVQPGGVEVLRSTDAGLSFTSRGVIADATTVRAAVAVGGGRHLVLADEGGAPRLFALDDAAALTVTARGGFDDGAYAFDPLSPRSIGLLGDGDEAVIVVQLRSGSLWRLRTRRVTADGVTVQDEVIATPRRHHPAMGVVLGDGTVVVPVDAGDGVTARLTTTTTGAAWVDAPDAAVVGAPGIEAFPPLIRLADGRAAMVTPWRYHAQREQVIVSTSADGVSWSAPTPVRGDGGALQRLLAARVEPGGALLVFLDDSGTFARPVISGAVANPALVRVPAP